MRTSEEVALDEIHRVHNESFVAGKRDGYLRGLRDARKMAHGVPEVEDLIDALIEKEEKNESA